MSSELEHKENFIENELPKLMDEHVSERILDNVKFASDKRYLKIFDVQLP